MDDLEPSIPKANLRSPRKRQ